MVLQQNVYSKLNELVHAITAQSERITKNENLIEKILKLVEEKETNECNLSSDIKKIIEQNKPPET